MNASEPHFNVVIVGAGPAGLMLAHQLNKWGVAAVLLENRNESYLRTLNRGGVLEGSVLKTLIAENVLSENDSEVWPLEGFDLNINSDVREIRINPKLGKPTGAVLAQGNLVNRFLDMLKQAQFPIWFEAKAQRFENLDSHPRVIYTQDGQLYSVRADCIVGCDGFRGISRRSIPPGIRQENVLELPLAWLEWQTPIEAHPPRPQMGLNREGFAMCIPERPNTIRYYLQVNRGVEIDDLPPDEALWKAAADRLGQSVTPSEIKHRKLDYMRTYSCSKIQYHRLFLAGDAARMTPRLGSKGLNLALKDAVRLAEALHQNFKNDDSGLLDAYSEDSIKASDPTMHYCNFINTIMHLEENREFEQQIGALNQIFEDSDKLQELTQFLLG